MIVRNATPQDFDSILDLLKGMHAEVGTWSLSLRKVIAQINECLSRGVVYVVELDGQIVGSIGLSIGEPWSSDDKFVGDYWNYVHPTARKTRAGKLLLKSALYFARELGIPFQPGVYGADDLPRKVKYFTRQGFEPVGMWFIAR